MIPPMLSAGWLGWQRYDSVPGRPTVVAHHRAHQFCHRGGGFSLDPLGDPLDILARGLVVKNPVPKIPDCPVLYPVVNAVIQIFF